MVYFKWLIFLLVVCVEIVGAHKLLRYYSAHSGWLEGVTLLVVAVGMCTFLIWLAKIFFSPQKVNNGQPVDFPGNPRDFRDSPKDF